MPWSLGPAATAPLSGCDPERLYFCQQGEAPLDAVRFYIDRPRVQSLSASARAPRPPPTPPCPGTPPLATSSGSALLTAPSSGPGCRPLGEEPLPGPGSLREEAAGACAAGLTTSTLPALGRGRRRPRVTYGWARPGSGPGTAAPMPPPPAPGPASRVGPHGGPWKGGEPPKPIVKGKALCNGEVSQAGPAALARKWTTPRGRERQATELRLGFPTSGSKCFQELLTGSDFGVRRPVGLYSTPLIFFFF